MYLLSGRGVLRVLARLDSIYSMDSSNTVAMGKSEVFDHFADVVKALANGRRLELLEVIAQGEHTVEALARMTGLAMTTTSNNLQSLRRVGLVTTRREGTSIYYRLAGGDVLELFIAAKRVALGRYPILADAVQSYMGHPRAHGPSIDPALVTEDMYVIDVRPAEEYEAGHFPGAVSIPAAEVEHRYAEVPQDREVVIYCRGELCRMAREAAAVLRGYGVDAKAMDEGVIEWRVSQEVGLEAAWDYH